MSLIKCPQCAAQFTSVRRSRSHVEQMHRSDDGREVDDA
jgi:uncharacterized C2H2 Zn-finger protein